MGRLWISGIENKNIHLAYRASSFPSKTYRGLVKLEKNLNTQESGVEVGGWVKAQPKCGSGLVNPSCYLIIFTLTSPLTALLWIF